MPEGSGRPVVAGAPSGVPRVRAVAAALVALEAVCLVGLAVYVAVETVVSTAEDPAGALALAGTTLVIGIGVGFCAWGVAGGRRWARAPVVTWQILQAGVAMPLSSSARWYLGIPLLALSVVLLVLMVGRHVIPPEE